MIKIPNNILDFFFREIKLKGKYEIDFIENSVHIIPKEEESYYKPIIIIPNLDKFTDLLIEYVAALNEFNKSNSITLKEYQDLSYIFNIMLFNMAPSDALNLNKFIETRISFFYDNNLAEFIKPKKIFEYNNVSFYAQREIENFGLETPYIMTFSMDIDGTLYNLPIIRYAINNDGICFIYAIQTGRGRICDINNINYKNTVNQVNQGVKEYRNISPSFVLILAIFLKILNDNNITKIVIPDFLFNRYKNYYRATTTNKSNEILSRMFHNIITLINRIYNQIDGFNIQSYPSEIESYFHIDINDLESENKMFKKLLKTDNNIN